MQLTSEDIQRYARIGLQWLAAWLVTHGTISATATWVEPVIGFVVGALSLAWTLYGSRVQAKVNEVAKLETTLENGQTVKLVETMKIHDTAIAAAAPTNVTTAPPPSTT